MMSQTTENKNQKLFMYLVGTFQSSAWIALGKMKNPMTKKVEKNINQASFYIDLLDMIEVKMKGNLSEYEEQLLINTVSELKMSFMDEKDKMGNNIIQKNDDNNDPILQTNENLSYDKTGEE